jgi:hypothetical protein
MRIGLILTPVELAKFVPYSLTGVAGLLGYAVAGLRGLLGCWVAVGTPARRRLLAFIADWRAI